LAALLQRAVVRRVPAAEARPSVKTRPWVCEFDETAFLAATVLIETFEDYRARRRRKHNLRMSRPCSRSK